MNNMLMVLLSDKGDEKHECSAMLNRQQVQEQARVYLFSE